MKYIDLTEEQGGGGGTSNHAQLTNLDYANSGHTGFMSSENFLPDGTIITVGATDANYTTIQDALTYLSDKWSNGEITISLATGTYSINDGIVIEDINYILNIEGHSVDDTIISLSADKEFIFKFIGNQKTNIININNVELTSSTTQTNCNGIWVDNLSVCNINNIKITNVSSGLISLNGGRINCIRDGATSINVSNRGFFAYGGIIYISQTHRVTITATNFGIQVSNGGYCIANGIFTFNVTNPLNQTKGQFTENGYISGQGV